MPDSAGWVRSLRGKAHFYDPACWWSICYRGADGERPRIELRPIGACARCIYKLQQRPKPARTPETP